MSHKQVFLNFFYSKKTKKNLLKRDKRPEIELVHVKKSQHFEN